MQPLFYAALALACGIAAGVYGPGSSAWAGGVAGILAAAALLCVRRRALAAGLALAFCLCAGYARARFVLGHPPGASALAGALARLQPKPRDRVFLLGYLRDSPELLYQDGRASAVRLDLEATAIGAGAADAIWPVNSGIRFYAYPPRPPRSAFGGTLEASDDAPEQAPPAGQGWAAGLMRLAAGAGLAVHAHLRPMAAYHDPGVADFAASAHRQGLDYTASLNPGAWQPWPGVRGSRLVALRASLWRWLSQRLDRLAPAARAPQLNGLLRGMLLGDVDRLDPRTRSAFQIDGVYHLVVVAGLHIGVLAWFLLIFFRFCHVPRFAAGALSLALLGLYAWTIAGRTPTVRALFMLALYFGASWWYRERQALNAVGFAALVLLAWHPFDLFSSGFQMSLGAATLLAGVALPLLRATSGALRRASERLDDPDYDAAFIPALAQWRLDLRGLATSLGHISPPLGWRILPGGLRALLRLADIVVISLVLQLGFAAFNAVYFHRANPWSLVANALLVPAAGLLIPLAWVGLALGHGLGWAVLGLGNALLHGASVMARWPGADLRVPSPPGWFLLLCGTAVAAWVAASLGKHRRAKAGTWGLMAALALVLALDPFAPRLPPGLSATVLDVGQGDSILVTFPDQRTMLVDGGPRSPHWDSGDEIVAPFLWSLGLRHLDAVLLTHGHNDHLGGLATVVADFHPGEVWVTRTLPGEAPVQAFLAQVRASGAKLRRLSAGDTFLAGSSRLEVLLPPPAYQAGGLASNDDSMVVRLSLGAESMLLEGDAEAGGERWMVDQHLPLASAMLKVGHHGSRTSSTPLFLAAVHPQVAIISDGAGNLYGHPAPDVVARLRQDGARVFRTDLDGAIQCRLSPTGLAVYLFRRPPGS